MESTTQAPYVKALMIGVEGAFDAEVQLGTEAITALRRDQIRELHEAQQEIEAGFEDLPAFNEAEARGAIETLTAALKRADAALAALWWLAPDDEREEQE
jgi:hypothetical protein